jgi:hypothetical protein
MSRTYVILTATQALNINYDDVLEDSPRSIRWNTTNTKTFVKFEGDTPNWLEGRTTYNHAEILQILNDPEGGWVSDPDDT